MNEVDRIFADYQKRNDEMWAKFESECDAEWNSIIAKCDKTFFRIFLIWVVLMGAIFIIPHL